MSVTAVLLDILVVLLAAKLAAEVAERVGMPAVVGEILAGVVIGPSALGLVGPSEALSVLAELGVILLLLQVGLEMDLAELGAVGRASLAVAVVGVVLPMVGGYMVAKAFGMGGNEALFIASALTATSVGITARVFGDLRALAMVEARTVLGAAVADDVIGLVILTVVTRLASEGSVSILSIGGIIGIAVGFLAVTSFIGVRAAPAVFGRVAKYSRSSGTLVGLALAFTLAVSELANAAKLAPIVGAFVAGLALARCPAAERIRRELLPVGHLFIPVFFLLIGIDADVGRFFQLPVVGLAAALFAVGVVGKLCSAAGLWGAPGDRLLVGLGMIPRGEVGLIFAILGLRQGILGEDVYAALLLFVLATTLLTPPLLRWRLLHLRASRVAEGPVTPCPDAGWLSVIPGREGGVVELAAKPPLGAALEVAFEAALLASDHRAGPQLLDWLSRLPDGPLIWDRAARAAFFEVLRRGSPRSWRFLALTGVLERALPELAQALSRRQRDPGELDPAGALRWPRLSRLEELGATTPLQHPEWLLLAAVVLDATEDEDGVPVARRIAQRLDVGARAEQAAAGLVADSGLLVGAARRADATAEEAILQLAVHLGSSEQATALYLLTLASNDLEPAERARLDLVHDLVQAVVRDPGLTGRDVANAVERRRAQARRVVTDSWARERIDAAPRTLVLAESAEDLARQARLCEPPLGRGTVRVGTVDLEHSNEWRVEFVARDRVGLLARETKVLAEAGFDVLDATVATWADGCALGSFRVQGASAPRPGPLGDELRHVLDQPLAAPPTPDARVVFDDAGSPWHTLCQVRAADRKGLLFAVTTAFATSGASVHAARVATTEGLAIDVFELTDKNGMKLDDPIKSRIRDALASGGTAGRRRFFRPALSATGNGQAAAPAKQKPHN
ncbi:MAG TPA: cation:proton antiporter [Acidimicrobiales bacterium]